MSMVRHSGRTGCRKECSHEMTQANILGTPAKLAICPCCLEPHPLDRLVRGPDNAGDGYEFGYADEGNEGDLAGIMTAPGRHTLVLSAGVCESCFWNRHSGRAYHRKWASAFPGVAR